MTIDYLFSFFRSDSRESLADNVPKNNITTVKVSSRLFFIKSIQLISFFFRFIKFYILSKLT